MFSQDSVCGFSLSRVCQVRIVCVFSLSSVCSVRIVCVYSVCVEYVQ